MPITSLIASLVSLTTLPQTARAVAPGDPIGPESRVWFMIDGVPSRVIPG